MKPAEDWAETVRIDAAHSRLKLIATIQRIQEDAMSLKATGLGSNQDADSFRDQAVDREREADLCQVHWMYHPTCPACQFGTKSDREKLTVPKPFIVTEAVMKEILMPDKFNETKKP